MKNSLLRFHQCRAGHDHLNDDRSIKANRNWKGLLIIVISCEIWEGERRKCISHYLFHLVHCQVNRKSWPFFSSFLFQSNISIYLHGLIINTWVIIIGCHPVNRIHFLYDRSHSIELEMNERPNERKWRMMNFMLSEEIQEWSGSWFISVSMFTVRDQTVR